MIAIADDSSRCADDHDSQKTDIEAAADKEKEEERRKLAHNESKAVSWLRVAVFLVLIATAVAVSLAIYNLVKDGQDGDFAMEFEAHADIVLGAFTTSVASKLAAMDALASQMTSYARSSNSVWPNVTFPDFEIWSSSTRVLADSVVINYHPLVTDETRAGWEAYFSDNVRSYDDTVKNEHEQRYYQDSRFGVADPEEEAPPAPEVSHAATHQNITNFDQTSAPDGSGP